jgi:hypothetical protein
MTLAQVAAEIGGSPPTVARALEIEDVPRRSIGSYRRKDVGDGLKQCPTCGRVMPTTAFGPDTHKSSGLNTYCRECDAARGRRAYARNPRPRPRNAPPRKCAKCDKPARSQRHYYCVDCWAASAAKRVEDRRAYQRERSKTRETPAERGYSWAHQKARQRWKVVIADEPVLCVRCGLIIDPDEPWDLGHLDRDQARYAGPEHRFCNRSSRSGPQTQVA